MRRRLRSQAGFTLVELLVALGLLGLLSLLLFAGLREGARTWESVEVRSDAVERTIAAQRLIRDQLSGLSRRGGEAAFVGGPTGMAFISTWLEHLPVAGSYVLEIAVRDDGSDASLVFDWRPAGETASGAAAAAARARVEGRRTLLDGLAGASFRYWGDPRSDGEPAWHRSWRAPEPPRLVRIELSFTDPRRSWPPLSVAIP